MRYAAAATAGRIVRGEGAPPLRVAGILPAIRGRDALDTKSKGRMPSPRYPGQIVPMGDIWGQSKWSG